MARTPYQKSDEAAAKIISKIAKEFRHNRVAFFDEMNIRQTKKHVHKLYTDVFKTIKKEFLAVADYICKEVYDEALALGFDGDVEDLDEAWIEEFFEEYNPVTKYVFNREIERKESRLFEALVSNNRERQQSYKTAENLLLRQVKQYSIDLEDAVAMTVYKAVGVKEVMWVTEQDHKTCGECKELDGEVYKLNEAPPKLHPNCRCYYVPVKE